MSEHPAVQRVLRTPGATPTVVFSNGLGMTLDFWLPVIDRLPDLATVSFDRPETMPTEPESLAGYVDEFATALTGVTSALIVVGHSYGALLAEAFARHAADRVVALVLVDPTAPEEYAGGDGTGDLPAWRRYLVSAVTALPASLTHYAAHAVIAGGTAVAKPTEAVEALHPDTSERLTTETHLTRSMHDDHYLPAVCREVLAQRRAGPLPIPVTVVAGGLGPRPLRRPQADWIETQRAQLAALSDDAELIVLDAAHLLMIDRPDELAAIIAAQWRQFRGDRRGCR